MKNFVFRLVITITVFLALRLLNFSNMIVLVALLFLFDSLDCGLSPFNIDCKTNYYQKNDKLVDMIIYVYFMILFGHLFDGFTQKLLWIMIGYRIIGVTAFYHTGNTLYLRLFPDFINSTMIAYIIYSYFRLSQSSYYLLIINGMIIKTLFEFYLHRAQYY